MTINCSAYAVRNGVNKLLIIKIKKLFYATYLIVLISLPKKWSPDCNGNRNLLLGLFSMNRIITTTTTRSLSTDFCSFVVWLITLVTQYELGITLTS